MKKYDLQKGHKISKVEVKGVEALFYDKLMDIITFGKYKKFIHSALSKIDIREDFNIIDLGCGTGRNILILNKFATMQGINASFYGIDKGKIMLQKAMKKTTKFSNIKILEGDIRENIKFNFKFDVGLISFVLHGFIQDDREKILNNFDRLIKRNGKLYILDYNEINIVEASFFVKTFFRKVECPLAEDFASRNLEKMLKSHKFKRVDNFYFFKNIVRMAVFQKI